MRFFEFFFLSPILSFLIETTCCRRIGFDWFFFFFAIQLLSSWKSKRIIIYRLAMNWRNVIRLFLFNFIIYLITIGLGWKTQSSEYKWHLFNLFCMHNIWFLNWAADQRSANYTMCNFPICVKFVWRNVSNSKQQERKKTSKKRMKQNKNIVGCRLYLSSAKNLLKWNLFIFSAFSHIFFWGGF